MSSQPALKRKRLNNDVKTEVTQEEINAALAIRAEEADQQKFKEKFGMIDQIQVINFMCHAHLSVKFGSNINFIIGSNGSGKSAILAALIIGLGGKTTTTSRGTSFKNLIKYGCSSATIKITLRNDGDDKFDPGIFGNRILVERKINIEGVSTYKLKTESNKLISNKREDIVKMLDQLNIQVENPLTCLNQELSKNFLHTKSEFDKYKFFLKTTQLEQIEADYNYIKEQKQKQTDYITKKERALPFLKRNVQQKEEAYKKLASISELRNRKEKLEGELAWSHVQEIEEMLVPVKDEHIRESDRVEKYKKSIKKLQEKEKEAKDLLDSLKSDVIKIKENQKKVLPEYKETENNLKKSKENYRKANFQKVQYNNEKEEALKELNNLQERIEEMKVLERNEKSTAAYNNAQEQLKIQRVKENELLQTIERFNTKVRELEPHTRELNHQKDNLTNQYQTYEQDQTNISRELAGLQCSKKNKLSLYGSNMVNFDQVVEQAFMANKFKFKPLGPIGRYLSVKDKNLVFAVEQAVKGYVNSFIVFCREDEKVLNELRSKHLSPFDQNRISIYTFTHSNSIYSTTTPNCKYRSILNLLSIEDPNVANFLIDWANIESQLVIPDIDDATEIMNNRKPHSVFKAFTIGGDQVFPGRFYSCFDKTKKPRYLGASVEQRINDCQLKIKQTETNKLNVRKKLDEVKQNIARHQLNINSLTNDKKTCYDQLSSIRIKISKFESVEEPVSYDWKDLEDEVQNKQVNIRKIDDKIRLLNKSMEEIQSEVIDFKDNFNEKKVEYDKLTSAITSLTQKLSSTNDLFDKYKAKQGFYNVKIQFHNDTIANLEKKMTQLQENIVKNSEKATQICTHRPRSKRSSSQVEEMISKVTERINSAERQHGKREVVVREFKQAKEKYDGVTKELKSSRELVILFDQYIETRDDAFSKLQKIMATQCIVDFDILLNQRKMDGKLIFDHESKKIKIRVSPKNDTTRCADDMKALSGGERSFSTVCFICALWKVMASPFRCLDEFDVFMDMANRRIAMELLTDEALRQPQVQFIFLTPNPLGNHLEGATVWKMPEPERGDVKE